MIAQTPHETSRPPLALVTGGSRGIGAAICERLARDGYTVIVNYSKNEAQATAVCDKIRQAGGQAEPSGFNVASYSEVTSKIDEIQARLGPISVLVNNAGINQDRLLLRLTEDDVHQVLDVNLKGAMYCTKAVCKAMMKARKGSIIFISSVVGEMGNAGQSAYAASKAGLIGFSKSVAKELAPRGIRSNVITPGYISTEMTGVLNEAQRDAILKAIPMEAMGEPSDIAHTVSFLASDQSRYLTGQVIGINGGMYI